MSNNIFAVVNSDGIIINCIVWNGNEEWTPPEGTTAINCESNICVIGGSYTDGEFLPPPPINYTEDELIEQAAAKKQGLLSQANSFTQPWQTQLMLGIISDPDKELLTKWMKYYQEVQAIDVSKAPNIIWPGIPS